MSTIDSRSTFQYAKPRRVVTCFHHERVYRRSAEIPPAGDVSHALPDGSHSSQKGAARLCVFHSQVVPNRRVEDARCADLDPRNFSRGAARRCASHGRRLAERFQSSAALLPSFIRGTIVVPLHSCPSPEPVAEPPAAHSWAFLEFRSAAPKICDCNVANATERKDGGV